MKKDDVALIGRILIGDETAFAELVRKYQKQVHVLAWRKIGDFHIAEDITQDVFLKVYQRLHTLKDPNQFSGWIYVITTRLCATWLRKNRIQTQPLEDVEETMGQRDAYSQHVVEEHAKTAVEAQREVVKKLLAKLKESERTVMTLHYLGEMTVTEISKFLGVSAGTIKSRLQRARNRLQKEETMIREALDHFQISPNLTDNIMREVARLKPAAPTGSKPLVPWAVAASTAVLIVLMLGISSQYLARFQKPYSLDAQAEATIELIDTPIVLNIEAKSDVQNRLGNPNIVGPSDNNGQKPDEVLFAAAQSEGEDTTTPKRQWIQSEPIVGSGVEGLFATEEGELYTVHDAHIYKWQDDRTGWQQVSGDIRDYHDKLTEIHGLNKVPIAKWNNILYIVLENLFLASKDGGKTWEIVHSWTDGARIPRELVLTEQAFWVIFYNGAFRSEDKGKTWKNVNDELPEGYIFLVAMENKVFSGTYTGLYRWNTGSWQRIEFPVPEAIVVTSAAGTKDRLYVMASLGPDLDYKAAQEGRQRTWWIFRSTDSGNSWEDITPTNAWPVKGWPPDIQLLAAGETLLLMGRGMVRSTDGGDTWMPRQDPSTLPLKIISYLSPAILNEHVFYVNSNKGLHRSTDGGKSWEKVKITQDKTKRLFLDNLIINNEIDKAQNMLPTLYGMAGRGIVKTTDKGKSWKTVQIEIPMTTPVRENPPWINQIIVSDGVIYAKGRSHYPVGELRYYRVSEDGKTLEPIQGIPTFDSRELNDHLRKSQNLSIETLQEEFSGATQFFKELLQATPPQQERIIGNGLRGPFAVSDVTFYMEYNFKLFRWEPGGTEWQDIGQEETSEISRNNLKLAVSGDTVYVGKRDGHLVVSYDRGNNWIDLTPALPFPVRNYKQILVAEATVYVATDAGIITSDDGRNWHAITDSDETNLIMEHLAVDGTTVYGITRKTGVYRLGSDSGAWEQIITEIPEIASLNISNEITSLAVVGNTLYVGSLTYGMLHFNLEE